MPQEFTLFQPPDLHVPSPDARPVYEEASRCPQLPSVRNLIRNPEQEQSSLYSKRQTIARFGKDVEKLDPHILAVRM